MADPLMLPGRGDKSNRAMSREETKPRFKTWLLAFALAAVLTWYVIHPAPGPIHRLQKEDDACDRERRQAHTSGTSHLFGKRPAIRPVAARVPAATDEDLPDWPEFIELN